MTNAEMNAAMNTGRSNQKWRTRTAIVQATRDLIRSGHELTMPEVARAALVAEATAYRYFPDLVSLLTEAMADLWPAPEVALEPVAGSADPVERVAFAAEYLLRGVIAYQGAVRAMISGTITRPEAAGTRPGYRFGLVDYALAPLQGTMAVRHPEVFAQLKRDLAVVVGAEAFYCLTDLCHLPVEEALASVIRTARTLTEAAVRADADQ